MNKFKLDAILLFWIELIIFRTELCTIKTNLNGDLRFMNKSWLHLWIFLHVNLFYINSFIREQLLVENHN